jgi:hypothetical protein
MDIHEIGYFDAPLEEVFKALRDKQELYLAALPVVSSAASTDSEEQDASHRITSAEWTMAPSMPVAPATAGADSRKWCMHALWSAERWTCEWRIENPCFHEELHIFGTLRFEEETSRTKCTLVAMAHLDFPAPDAEAKMSDYIVKYILNKDFMINDKAFKKISV